MDMTDLRIVEPPGGFPVTKKKGRIDWKNHVFHYSQLASYTKCPWMFKLKYIYGLDEEMKGIGAARGSAIHDSIYKIKQEDLWSSAIDVAIKAYDDEIDDESYNDSKEEKSFEKESKKGRDMCIEVVRNYAIREEKNKNRVMFSEIPFSVLIKGNKFAGKIDEIRDGEDGIELVDFKSDLAVPSLICLMNSLQFMIYGIAMNDGMFFLGEKEFKINSVPSKVVWYHLRHLTAYKRKSYNNGVTFNVGDMKGGGNPEVIVPWDEFEIDRSAEEVRKIIGAIKGNHFYKRPASVGACNGFCYHNETCVSGVTSCDYNVEELLTK